MIKVIEQFIVNYMNYLFLRVAIIWSEFMKKKKEKWSQAVNVTTIIILKKSRSTERITDLVLI